MFWFVVLWYGVFVVLVRYVLMLVLLVVCWFGVDVVCLFCFACCVLVCGVVFWCACVGLVRYVSVWVWLVACWISWVCVLHFGAFRLRVCCCVGFRVVPCRFISFRLLVCCLMLLCVGLGSGCVMRC